MQPAPTHLNQRDPGKPADLDINAEADREIDHYAQDLHDLVLLIPEEKWDAFLRATGAEVADGAARYREVAFRPAAITAVVAQEGF